MEERTVILVIIIITSVLVANLPSFGPGGDPPSLPSIEDFLGGGPTTTTFY